jgi:hypothetical protein
VISAYGKSLSHKCNGKVGSTEESPTTKFSLKLSDGSFRGVAEMAVGCHQLVLHVIGGEKNALRRHMPRCREFEDLV